ncbi:MAG: T9SS type A sorting domain-containing protein, partial [Fimbriimonadaceae bacterium]|nr:T9SS type A sorting domain-containing protein [Chitinophagales bacterium]
LETFACDENNIWLGGYVYDLITLDTFELDGEAGDFYQPFLARYGSIEIIADTCNATFTYSYIDLIYSFTFTSTDDVATYEWDFGDGNFSGVINPVHTYEANGEYIVCLTITTTDGCVDSTCTTIVVTGASSIENDPHSKVFIYPNPFTNTFLIEKAENISVLAIRNMHGENMIYTLSFSGNNLYTIQIPDILPGIYIVETTDGKQTGCKKILALGNE